MGGGEKKEEKRGEGKCGGEKRENEKRKRMGGGGEGEGEEEWEGRKEKKEKRRKMGEERREGEEKENEGEKRRKRRRMGKGGEEKENGRGRREERDGESEEEKEKKKRRRLGGGGEGRLDFLTATPRRREAGPTKWYRPRRLMEPEQFQRELGPIPEALTHDSAETLVAAWDRTAAGAVDRIAPLRPLLWRGSRSAPWFTEGLREMKRQKRCLESRWRRSRSEPDRTRVKAHIKAYLAAIRVEKCAHLTVLIASSDNRPASLFRVTK